MKKTKKIVALVIAVVAFIGIITFVTLRILQDENKLTVEEKEWITENINVVQNVSVINNIDVFGKNGSGLFYDFIEDFEQEFKLDINPITYNSGETTGTKSFKIVYDLDDKHLVFYKEHYVVISKNKENIRSLSNLNSKKIGVISSDEKNIAKYLGGISNVSLLSYETSTNLLEKLNENTEIEYAIIPLEENLTSILTSNFFIDFHISDLNKYFVYEIEDNDTFSAILKKYYANWQKENQKKSYNKNELATFVEALSITDKELANLQAKTYNYGFIDNNPYEVLISANYGGIISEYLARWKEFSNTEFKFIKYKNFSKLTEAIAGNKIDLFYNYYYIQTEYKKIDSLSNISFVIVSNEADDTIINSIASLTDKTVYVEKNSLLEKYITSIGGVNIKTYADDKDLKKIAKKNNLIAIDRENFNYYHHGILVNYNIRYSNTLSETYNFYTKNSDTFYLLFNKYIQTLDPESIRINGIHNHSLTVESGTIISKIAKYSLLIILIIFVIIFLIYRSSKKIKIAKKIKKEDKIKFIDQLTSLKNRNYLNENITNWNKNTIYPQATIIIDLNQVQEINDTLGYEQGDQQIKAAANILIKTQLDNSDIMRTDGNEFLIYLVGYQEKQVVSYIRKLYKEFKNLPYEYGAAIGYSIITNDMKTIEDSINESVEDMKIKKEEIEENEKA